MTKQKIGIKCSPDHMNDQSRENNVTHTQINNNKNVQHL